MGRKNQQKQQTIGILPSLWEWLRAVQPAPQLDSNCPAALIWRETDIKGAAAFGAGLGGAVNLQSVNGLQHSVFKLQPERVAGGR